MIHEKVKQILESKGWDFSSDFFDDEELNSINEVIEATIQAVFQPHILEQRKQQYCGDCGNYVEWDNGIKWCSVCGNKLS
jgi:NADH pyrophosphatase NudC (nudix superfamily)